MKLNNKNHLYNTRFVLTKSGTVYALYVYDLALANEFVNKYPLEQMPGFSPRFPEPIFDEIDRISTYLEGQGIDRLIARERALSFILTKYNSGAIVLKQDSNGNFKALQIEEKISNGVKNYVEKDCGYISKSDEESKLLYGS